MILGNMALDKQSDYQKKIFWRPSVVVTTFSRKII